MESFKVARRLGISLAEYDEMTPKELNIIADVLHEKFKTEAEDQLQLQWMNAYWQRVETLKPFNEEVEKPQPEKRMSDLQMQANVEKLNALFKGNVQ